MCDRCGKKYNHKGNFVAHLNRKNHCNSEINDISIESLKLKYGINKNIKKEKQVYTKLYNNENKYICEQCGKFFIRKDSIVRHLKKYCKYTNNMSGCNNDAIEELKVKIKILEDKNIITNITNHINQTQTINNNTINITINNFGEEDYSHITSEFVKNLITNINSSSIAKMFEAVHFNNPYNLNIKLPNKKDSLITIWQNNKWISDLNNNILDGIIVKNFDRIHDFYEELEEKLSENIKSKYNNYADQFEKIKGEERKLVKKETELVLLNNSNDLIEDFNYKINS